MTTDVKAERAEIEQLIAGRTLCHAFSDTVERRGDAPALCWLDNGQWVSLSWRGYRDTVRDACLGLRQLGINRGDFGVILARNRPEHLAADLALVHAGATPVSLYSSLVPNQIAYIAGHCEAKVAIVEDAGFLGRLAEVRDQLPQLRVVVVIDPTGVELGDGVITWADLLARGAAAHREDPAAFDRSWQAVTPADIATIVYTSGTTGPPKGVMDTHQAVLFVVESNRRVLSIGEGDRIVSYLPLAHTAERWRSHWQGVVIGTTTYCVPDPNEIGSGLITIRPHAFFAVPRIWEKLKSGLETVIAGEATERRRALEAGLAVGREVSRLKQAGVQPPADLQEQYTGHQPQLRELLAHVGLGETRFGASGGAPIAVDVLEFFDALGLPIVEVWGMSESAAPATCSPLGRLRFGTVGCALPGVELRVADDGELLMRSGSVMVGYYRDPERTAEALDADGWLHTGDVARIDADGYVQIVDRKKELIITAGAKNISPANIEYLLKEHPLVGQACVIGDRRPYLVALLVPDAAQVRIWAETRGLGSVALAELCRTEEFLTEMQAAVDTANKSLARVEQIKRFTVLPTEWTAESEELTPTLKLKRKVISTKYAEEIEGLYAGSPA